MGRADSDGVLTACTALTGSPHIRSTLTDSHHKGSLWTWYIALHTLPLTPAFHNPNDAL